MMNMVQNMYPRLILHTDGGSRNRKIRYAAAASVITDGEQVIREATWYLGSLTNNQAEYTALVRGMEIAAEIGCIELICISDSQLMVRQMAGDYRVKSPQLCLLYLQAKKLELRFHQVIFAHVSRDHPFIQHADKLLNNVLDEYLGKKML